MQYNGQLSEPATVIYTDKKGDKQKLTFNSFSEVLAIVKSLSDEGRYCEIHQGNNVYSNNDWLKPQKN